MMSKYAKALGLDGQSGEPELARELAGLTLPALELPTQRPQHLAWPAPHERGRVMPPTWPQLAAAALVCAVLGAFAWRQLAPTGPDLSVKGSARVSLFAEQNGQVAALAPGAHLANGDRVQAEVLASDRTLAYWGTFDRRGELLETWSSLRDSAMELRPGERKIFPTSLRLEGKNEGETVVVLVCPAAEPLPPSLETGALAPLFRRFLGTPGEASAPLVGSCKAWKFQLR